MASLGTRDSLYKGIPIHKRTYKSIHRARATASNTGVSQICDKRVLMSDGWVGTVAMVAPCGCEVHILYCFYCKPQESLMTVNLCPHHNESHDFTISDEMKAELSARYTGADAPQNKTEGRDTMKANEKKENGKAKKDVAGKTRTKAEGKTRTKKGEVKASTKKISAPELKAGKKSSPKRNGDLKKITCPECGIDNPISNVKCEVCGTTLIPKSGRARADVVLFELNKKLAASMDDLSKDPGNRDLKDKTAELRLYIKNECKKSRAFTQDKDGFAINVTVEKKEEASTKKSKKTSHICPCCGEKTNPGSYFIPGHDARVKGILKRMNEGTEKGNVPEAVTALYKIMKTQEEKNLPKPTIKELCILAGF